MTLIVLYLVSLAALVVAECAIVVRHVVPRYRAHRSGLHVTWSQLLIPTATAALGVLGLISARPLLLPLAAVAVGLYTVVAGTLALADAAAIRRLLPLPLFAAATLSVVFTTLS
jgi:hypothetical protein